MLLAGDLRPQDIGSRIHVDGVVPIQGFLVDVQPAAGGMVDIEVRGYPLPFALWPDQLVALDPIPSRPIAVVDSTHDAEVHSFLSALARKQGHA